MRASFPPFLVDTATRQLLRGGEELPLPPKAFELLAMLIERRPQAISQKELYDHLWPDSYVGAGSLHSLIHQLRSALDDHQRRIIRTAYGFGWKPTPCGIWNDSRPYLSKLRCVVTITYWKP